MRAFAVIAVILDHLIGWPHGGYVGVDIFFVISGFLITGLLLREHERTGHISFIGFYRRRIRRIIPASVLVLGVTLAGAYFVFNAARYQATIVDALWALLFSGNWRFAALSTDYFNASGPVSPLQHYWSLGVEEQFYFVWPWVMLLIFGVLIRRSRSVSSARVVVGVVITVISAVSFAWSLWETKHVPDRAYFSTLTRTWELGVGAMLAVFAPTLNRLPARLRPVLAWIGLAAMTASLWFIGEFGGFPAPAAALPVLSAALVIAAGTGVAQQPGLFPLNNPVSTYVGDISYSLYLWHFPIIILGTTLFGDAPAVLAGLGAVLSLTAIYSFHLFEDPIRRSPWLERKGSRSHGPRRLPAVSDRYQLTALSAAVILTAGLVVAAVWPNEPPRSFAVDLPTQTGTASAGPAVPAVQRQLDKQLVAALQATAWPSLTPSMDEAIDGTEAPNDISGCGGPSLVNPASCTWGRSTAPKTAVLVGDSVSMTYAAPLRKIFTDQNWRFLSYGSFGCAFTETLIQNSDTSLQNACSARKADAVSAIKAAKPDVVIVANVYLPRTPAGSTTPMSESAWSDSTLKEVNKFRSAAKRVAFLAAPPADKTPEDCYTRQSVPADCVGEVTSAWSDRASTEQDLAAQLHGTWIDSSPWFCYEDVCPAFVGSTPVKIDLVHMTQPYAMKIVPAIRSSLRQANVL